MATPSLTILGAPSETGSEATASLSPGFHLASMFQRASAPIARHVRTVFRGTAGPIGRDSRRAPGFPDQPDRCSGAWIHGLPTRGHRLRDLLSALLHMADGEAPEQCRVRQPLAGADPDAVLEHVQRCLDNRLPWCCYPMTESTKKVLYSYDCEPIQ